MNPEQHQFFYIVLLLGTLAAVVGSCSGSCSADNNDGDLASMLQTGRQVIEVKTDLDLHGQHERLQPNRTHEGLGKLHSNTTEKHLGNRTTGNISLNALQGKAAQISLPTNISNVAVSKPKAVHQHSSSKAIRPSLDTEELIAQAGKQVSTEGAVNPEIVTTVCVVCYLVIALALIVHELATWLGDGSSSFAGHGISLFQRCGYSVSDLMVLLCGCGFLEINLECTSIIPTSYDLSVACGYGAGMSGWLCSFAFIGLVPGGILTKRFLREEEGFSHRRARAALGIGAAVSTIATGLYAAAFSQFQPGKTLFWILLALRVLIGTGLCPIGIICGLMAFRVLSSSGKTMFSMINNVNKNLGLAAGPFLSAVAIQTRLQVVNSQGSGQLATVESLSPIDRAQWTAFASSCCCLCFWFLLLLAIPLEDQDLDLVSTTPRPAQQPTRVVSQPQINVEMPEDLSEEDRKKMFWYTLAYSTERAFTVAAVEVSTLMLLETSYDKNVVDSSYLFSIISFICASVSFLVMMAMRYEKISEMSVSQISISFAVCGSVFFFDWGGFATLLIADLTVYCFSGVAMGIAEAWGARSSMEGTKYSEQTFRQYLVMLVVVVRLLCPPLARMVVDAGGRTAYAAAQFVVACSGCYTLMKAVWLLAALTDKTPSKSEKEPGDSSFLQPREYSRTPPTPASGAGTPTAGGAKKRQATPLDAPWFGRR